MQGCKTFPPEVRENGFSQKTSYIQYTPGILEERRCARSWGYGGQRGRMLKDFLTFHSVNI